MEVTLSGQAKEIRETLQDCAVKGLLTTEVAHQCRHVRDGNQVSLNYLCVRGLAHLQLANVTGRTKGRCSAHSDASWTILTPALAPMRVAPAATTASALS